MEQQPYQEKNFIPPSYYNEQLGQIDFNKFYLDTIGSNSELDVLSEVCEQIKSDTLALPNGSTNQKNLELCRGFLLDNDIDIKDESLTYDLNIVRVLKMFPTIFTETHYFKPLNSNENRVKPVDLLRTFIKKIIISPEDEYLREVLQDQNGRYLTREDLARKEGYSFNTQRLITERELGATVMPHVAKLFNYYITEIQRKG